MRLHVDQLTKMTGTTGTTGLTNMTGLAWITRMNRMTTKQNVVVLYQLKFKKRKKLIPKMPEICLLVEMTSL